MHRTPERILLFLTLAMLLMGGCVSRGTHAETVRELEELRKEQALATQKIRALQRKTDDLQHALEIVNRTREGAEAARGGLQDQVNTLRAELERTKRAREAADLAGLEQETRIKMLQQQLQKAERERDQVKAAQAGRSRSGTGKATPPKKSPQAPVPPAGKEQKPE